MTFDADTLARQLAQLGRDLQDEVAVLAELELAAVTAEGAWWAAKDGLEQALDEEFLHSEGGVEARRASARTFCFLDRDDMRRTGARLALAKAKLRNQEASIRALNKRIDIGRSLLSREKALMEMDQ